MGEPQVEASVDTMFGVIGVAWARDGRLLASRVSGVMFWYTSAGRWTPGPTPLGYVAALEATPQGAVHQLASVAPLPVPGAGFGSWLPVLASQTITTLGTASRMPDGLRLRIYRNGELLQESVDPQPDRGQPLRLRIAWRRGVVSAQLNQEPELRLRDGGTLAPEGGSFAASVGPRLVPRVVASRYWLAPVRATEAERADRLSAVGRFEEALAVIRRAHAAARTGGTDAELRYKEGLCLESLARLPEAIEAYEGLLEDEPARTTAARARWVVLAAVRIAELHLFTDSPKARAAFAVIARLPAELPLGELLTTRATQVMLSAYGPLLSPAGLVRHDPTRVEQLRTLDAILARLGTRGAYPRTISGKMLLTALFREHRLADAIEFGTRLLQNPSLTRRLRRDVVEQLVWIHGIRSLNDPVDHLLQNLENSPDRNDRLLAHLSHARRAVRASDWPRAASHLAAFERVGGPPAPWDGEAAHWYLAAGVLRGFVAEAEGGWLAPVRARAEWVRGYQYWQRTGLDTDIYGAILASLSRQLTPLEAERMVRGVLQQLNAAREGVMAAPLNVNQIPMYVIHPSLRQMWDCPQGHALARMVAARGLPHLDDQAAQVKLIVTDVIRGLVREAKPSAEVHDELWAACNQLFDLYAAGQLPEAQIAPMILPLVTKAPLPMPRLASGRSLPPTARVRVHLLDGYLALAGQQWGRAAKSFQLARELAGDSDRLRACAAEGERRALANEQ